MSDTIRVILHQPVLPKYRLPVFRELASRPGIQLEVLYGVDPDLAPNADKIEGFPHRFTPCFRWPKPIVYWQREHLRTLKRTTTDVVIIPWNTRYLSLLPALLTARSRGIGTVLWGHGYSKRESPIRSWLRRRPVRLADAVLFYSRSIRDRFAEGEPDATKLFVAPNALDQSQIQAARTAWLADPARLAQFKQDKGLVGEENVIFVSRLEHANRVDLLVEAAAHLVKNGRPNFRVIVVGAGPELDALKALAAERGVAERVHFAGAVYGEQEIAPYFLSAQIFCYPRNIGLSLLHAFGYGIPLVTTDSRESQNPEIDAFEPGINGLTYRDQDPADLAKTLAAMLDDRARLKSMSDHAHATATGRFSLPSMVDGMEAAIRHAHAHRARA